MDGPDSLHPLSLSIRQFSAFSGPAHLLFHILLPLAHRFRPHFVLLLSPLFSFLQDATSQLASQASSSVTRPSKVGYLHSEPRTAPNKSGMQHLDLQHNPACQPNRLNRLWPSFLSVVVHSCARLGTSSTAMPKQRRQGQQVSEKSVWTSYQIRRRTEEEPSVRSGFPKTEAIRPTPANEATASCASELETAAER